MKQLLTQQAAFTLFFPRNTPKQLGRNQSFVDWPYRGFRSTRVFVILKITEHLSGQVMLICSQSVSKCSPCKEHERRLFLLHCFCLPLPPVLLSLQRLNRSNNEFILSYLSADSLSTLIILHLSFGQAESHLKA